MMWKKIIASEINRGKAPEAPFELATQSPLCGANRAGKTSSVRDTGRVIEIRLLIRFGNFSHGKEFPISYCYFHQTLAHMLHA